MIRHAFTMKLRPGAFAEYKRLHDNLWPELFAEIERSGVATMTIFESDPDLFLFSESGMKRPGPGCGIRRSITAGRGAAAAVRAQSRRHAGRGRPAGDLPHPHLGTDEPVPE
jgi:hypothetical protein